MYICIYACIHRASRLAVVIAIFHVCSMFGYFSLRAEMIDCQGWRLVGLLYVGVPYWRTPPQKF